MSRTFKIRAKTLDAAMRRAKVQFGANVMVVDTQHLKIKEPDKMALSTVVELIVSPERPERQTDPDPKLELTTDVFEVGYANQGEIERLQGDIERIDKLIQSVSNAELKLRQCDDSYPLADALVNAGTTRGGLRVLQSSFEERVPASERQNRAEALKHLTLYLSCTGTEKLSDMSGTHVFLGSAGSGKTTLVVKLASALASAGKSVAIILAAPYHSGEVRRIETAASALMIDAAVARDEADLERVLAFYAGKDAVLVDTPCWLSPRSGAARGIHDHLKAREDVYKHYVCPLTHDFRFLLQELELYREWGCDFLALSRVDLMQRVGKVVDLALTRRVVFSLIGREDEADGAGATVATPGALLDALGLNSEPERATSGTASAKT